MRVRVLSALLVLSFVLGPGASAGGTDLSGAIGGRVTDDSGAPIEDVCIHARHADLEVWGGTRVRSRADGTYWITGLRDGSYTISFNECWRAGLENVVLEDQEVELGRSTTVDVTLSPLGTISGTVRGDDGAPVSEICVSAGPVPTDDGGVGIGRWADARTDQDGRYSMALSDGDYLVDFSPCSESTRDLVRSWYPNAASYEQAEPVTVQNGANVDGIDGQLPTGGRISGSVHNSEGAPIEEVCVIAEAGSSYAWARTASDGTYLMRGVRPGEAKVRFWDCSWDSSGPRYAPQWYPDAPDKASATAVAVVSAETTPGIDVSLAVGGSISGKVTRTDGQTSSACVYVYDLDGGWIGSTWSNTGEYRVDGLPAGEYLVQFSGCFDAGSVWWEGKADMESADPLNVELSAERTGINAVVPVSEPPTVSLEIEEVLVLRNLQEEGAAGVEGTEDRSVWVDVQVSSEHWYWSVDARLTVCPATAGSCRETYGSIDANPGRTSTTRFDWTPTGVGTFNLKVQVDLYGPPVHGQDIKTVRHDVVLRGTGVGVGR